VWAHARRVAALMPAVSRFGVGMYLRTTQRHNRDGSVVRYLQLAQNRRVDGVTQAQVLVNLGREDRLDREALARLAASIDRYLTSGDSPRRVIPSRATIAVGGARSSGAVGLLDGLWRELHISAALRAVVGGRRLTRRMERAVFALVAHTAVAPPEPSVARWVTLDVAVPGLPDLDEAGTAQALELLLQADRRFPLQETVFLRVVDLLGLDGDVLFCTQLGGQGARCPACPCTLEEGRGDGPDTASRPTVQLVVSRDGTPARAQVRLPPPAGERGTGSAPSVAAARRVISVIDGTPRERPAGSVLEEVPGPWITTPAAATSDARTVRVLARQGRYREVGEGLRVKEVRLDDDPGTRWLVCHDRGEAERQAARRAAALARLSLEPDGPAVVHVPGAPPAPRQRGAAGPASPAVGDHRDLRGLMRELPSGRLVPDRRKVAAAERLDGKYVLRTNDLEVPAADLALGHRHLVEARRTFHRLGGGGHSGPGLRGTGSWPEAQVVLRWLALLLVRLAERRSGLPWRQIALELGRVQTITAAGSLGVASTLRLTREQAAILAACRVRLPPPGTSGHRT
jgi:hypothetical protein